MSNLKTLMTELTNVEGISNAVVVGRDGFVIDSSGNSKVDPDAIGAVISSGIGSSEIMGRELGIGSMSQCLLEFDGGVIVTSLLGSDAVLAVVADARGNLGNIRFQVKKRSPEVLRAL